MPAQRYLIIGGGMTGHAAAAAIREADREGAIAILSEESVRPYARPPLSKGLWMGKPEQSVWLPEVPGEELHLGRRAVALDLGARAVRDDRGELHRYDRLLLATGAGPRRLAASKGRIIYFRTFPDYQRLRAIEGRHIAVIGAGFIGSEIAAALAQNGKEVTLVFPEQAIGAGTYPSDLAAFVTRTYEQKGVRLLAGERGVSVEESGERTLLRTVSGKEVVADAIVAGLGVRPNTSLAEAAGIRCVDGVEVDAWLQTSARGVFAAGDVARFPCRLLGERIRVEHEDAALTMGRAAGRNMAGANESYDHLPFFYSDLFDLGYEAVGRLDARLKTVANWKTPFHEGVVCYLEGERVRGVLLWGIFGKVAAARRLIEGGVPPRREELAEAIQ